MAFPNQKSITAEGVVGQGGHMTPVDVKHARRDNVAVIVVDNLDNVFRQDRFSLLYFALSCGSLLTFC